MTIPLNDMLMDLVYQILNSVLGMLLFILPSFPVSNVLNDILISIYQYGELLNNFVPIVTIISCIGYILTFHALLYALKLGISIINWARGAGSIDI